MQSVIVSKFKYKCSPNSFSQKERSLINDGFVQIPFTNLIVPTLVQNSKRDILLSKNVNNYLRDPFSMSQYCVPIFPTLISIH